MSANILVGLNVLTEGLPGRVLNTLDLDLPLNLRVSLTRKANAAALLDLSISPLESNEHTENLLSSLKEAARLKVSADVFPAFGQQRTQTKDLLQGGVWRSECVANTLKKDEVLLRSYDAVLHLENHFFNYEYRNQSLSEIIEHLLQQTKFRLEVSGAMRDALSSMRIHFSTMGKSIAQCLVELLNLVDGWFFGQIQEGRECLSIVGMKPQKVVSPDLSLIEEWTVRRSRAVQPQPHPYVNAYGEEEVDKRSFYKVPPSEQEFYQLMSYPPSPSQVSFNTKRGEAWIPAQGPTFCSKDHASLQLELKTYEDLNLGEALQWGDCDFLSSDLREATFIIVEKQSSFNLNGEPLWLHTYQVVSVSG